MFYKSKYVIIDQGSAPIPVVFSELLAHAEVVSRLGGAPLGAGFCHVTVTEDGARYVCYGKSMSLGVHSREDEDARILNKYLGLTEEY